MTDPAPVNPQTFRYIREHAVDLPDGELARRLGWDVPKLHRVNRERQLGVTLTEGPAWPTATKRRPATKQAPAPVAAPAPPPPPQHRANLSWNAEDGTLTRDGAGIIMRGHAGVMLGELVNAYLTDGGWRSSYPLSELVGCERHNVGVYIKRIVKAIAPLGLGIETLKARNGGYGLVDLLSEQKQDAAE